MLSNLEDFMSGKNSFVMLSVKADDQSKPKSNDEWNYNFPVVIDLDKYSLEQDIVRHMLVKVTKRS